MRKWQSQRPYSRNVPGVCEELQGYDADAERSGGEGEGQRRLQSISFLTLGCLRLLSRMGLKSPGRAGADD